MLPRRHGSPHTLAPLAPHELTPDPVSGQSGRTALHYGCKKGHATVVRLLLAAKADILSKDGQGLTPKELATKNSKDQVVAIMDDFEKHRSTLVWVSQKSAWLGMANARLRANTAAAGLPEKLWVDVVAKVSKLHVQRPKNDVICRFHWRGTLALQQGFDWRISQLQPPPAQKPEAQADSATPPAATPAEGAEADAKKSEDGAAGDTAETKDKDTEKTESSTIKQESPKKGSAGRKRKDKEEAAEPAKRSRR
eukprot:COSAG02_NODE_4126_length_5741_cov_164.845090_6_plen_252_part_00